MVLFLAIGLAQFGLAGQKFASCLGTFFFLDGAVIWIQFQNLATSNADVLLHLVTRSIFGLIFKDNQCTITLPCSFTPQWCSNTSVKI
jgi:hypothetical protein